LNPLSINGFRSNAIFKKTNVDGSIIANHLQSIMVDGLKKSSYYPAQIIQLE